MKVPDIAMVMSAGFGTRLRPLTDRIPKPMVPVQGVPMIDLCLDLLADAGVKRAVVNLHHLGHLIREHLSKRCDIEILFSEEEEILETGGGTKKALPLLGDEPFFTINAKIILRNGARPALHRLAAMYDPEAMDSLLLLQPKNSAIGYEGEGDFFLAENGQLRRRRMGELAPCVYAGISICHPRIFATAPDGAFSLNLLWDQSMDEGKLYGMPHDGEWYHVSSLRQLEEVEKELAARHIRLRS